MIKKLSLLTDKKYIINFSILWSLITRYWINCSIFTLLAIGYFSYIYISQDKIYLRKVSFMGQTKGAAGPSIPGFLTGTSGGGNTVNLNSLRGILESWEYKAQLTELLLLDNDFSKYDFSTKKEVIIGDILLEKCADNKSCVFESLDIFFKNNIKIVKNTKTPGFTLRIHGNDEYTVKKIEQYVVSLLNQHRKKQLSRDVELRTEMLNQMIDKKNKDFGTNEFDNLKEELTINKNRINDLDKSIKEVQFMRNKEKAKLFEIDLKLEYIDSKIQSKSNEEDSVSVEKRRKLEINLIKLQKNQDILKVNNQNGSNDIFISQISKKINIIKNELKKYGRLSHNAQTFDSLQKNKNEIIPELTIKKNVLTANVKKLEDELEQLDETRSIISKQINQIKNKINEINPDYQLILDLKKHYNQSLIKSSTIVSDLQFESFRPMSNVLRPHSLKKTVIFIFLSCLFIPILIIVVRFILEKKIYTQSEINNEFPDIKILGHSSKIAL